MPTPLAADPEAGPAPVPGNCSWLRSASKSSAATLFAPIPVSCGGGAPAPGARDPRPTVGGVDGGARPADLVTVSGGGPRGAGWVGVGVMVDGVVAPAGALERKT